MTNEGQSTINAEILMMPEACMGTARRQLSKPVVCGINVYCVANATIGRSRALDSILTERKVRAEEAYIVGMVNRVVPSGDALNAALDLAKFLPIFPQSALKNYRDSIYSNFQPAMQNERFKDLIDEMQEKKRKLIGLKGKAAKNKILVQPKGKITASSMCFRRCTSVDVLVAYLNNFLQAMRPIKYYGLSPKQWNYSELYLIFG
uniref:Uncharacterized protein n=1 Tax=Glossina austeni TaxID=7395 RepID=A0A1A9UEA4_GLOAU